MSFLNLIKSSLLNLKAHKLRVFLTMIGIIIGISSVITVLSIGAGLEHMVTKSAEDASANKYTLRYDTGDIMSRETVFTSEDFVLIEQIDGVDKAEQPSGMNIMGGTGEFVSLEYATTNTQMYIGEYNNESLDLHSGRKFNDDEKKVVILGEDTAKSIFGSYTEPLGKGVKINGEFFEVIGVSKPETTFGMKTSTTYVPKDSIPKSQNEDGFNYIEVSLDPSKDSDVILEEVKTVVKESHADLKGEFVIDDPAQTVELFSTIIGGLTGFVAIVTSISLFVGGIGIMNIMYVSVTERKREIGIRRAIGARPRDILMQFLVEAIFITGLGGIVGIVTGFIVANIVGLFLPFSPILTLTSILGASAVSVIVGIVFGIIPAYNASKLDPIKAIYK